LLLYVHWNAIASSLNAILSPTTGGTIGSGKITSNAPVYAV
jgi:hypothetical protein